MLLLLWIAWSLVVALKMRPLKTLIKKVKITKAHKFIYARPFNGLPSEDDLQIVEEELPELKDGG